MSLTQQAKAVGLFTLLAIGAGITLTIMTGGGYRSGPSLNTDPRSILVEAHLISYRSTEGWLDAAVSPADHALDAPTFDALIAGAIAAQATGATEVRSPSMLVQHKSEGSITAFAEGRRFEITLRPAVVDDDAIRVSLQTSWSGPTLDADNADCTLATAFTSDGSGGIVLDLTGVPGVGGLLLALRPTLIDASQD
ncbi:MAG: hypothetical protein RIB32_01835 [Phycisphaerales bacterium]